MFTIKFNSKTSPYASKYRDEMLMYLKYTETYINDLLRIRGFVYAHEIYNLLGIAWDPDMDNLCRRYNNKPIKFKIRGEDEDGFEIDID